MRHRRLTIPPKGGCNAMCVVLRLCCKFLNTTLLRVMPAVGQSIHQTEDKPIVKITFKSILVQRREHTRSETGAAPTENL